MVKIKVLLDILAYAACLLGVAPLYGELDPPVRLIFPLALAAGILFDRRRRYPLAKTPATLLSVVCFTFYLFGVSPENLVLPAVNVLCLLLAVRLVTEKTSRHYLQIFVLAIFSLAASSLLSLSVAFFFYLVALVILVTVGLVLLSFHATDEDLLLSPRQARKIVATALLLPAVSLVLMLIFFVILPRTQRPLWNFLNPSPAARAGFGDRVSPGSFASIAAVKEIAFRAESRQLQPDELYWRGIVLNALDGNHWIRRIPPEKAAEGVRGGERIVQTIFPEPNRGLYLFALDVPERTVGIRAGLSTDRVLSLGRPLRRRTSYESVSRVGGVIVPPTSLDRQFYLEVPEEISERVSRVGEEIAAGGNPEDKIALLEAFFRRQNLSYATEDLPGPADPVDEFLFEKKRGYCEFFASSFALLLRLSGVPARLVGGYYGGEYNEMGGYYAVTEDTAHVWVEALVEEMGWVRIDPSRLAGNSGEALLTPRSKRAGILRRISDAVDYYWNQAVIGYDFGRQIQLARKTGLKVRGVRISEVPKKALWYLLAALTAFAGACLAAKRRRIGKEERILKRYLVAVEKRYGEAVAPTEGLEELAERLKEPLCREFSGIYGGAVYRDRKLKGEELERLKEIIKTIKKL